MLSIIPATTWNRTVKPGAPRLRPERITEMTVHYTGSPRVNKSIDQIAAYIKQTEASHMARSDAEYSAIAYNFAIDKWGRIWELRGWDYINAANGTSSNSSSFSVVCLIGVEDNNPTPEIIAALQNLYKEGCRRFGRKLEVKGHQEHKATACPGQAMMELIRSGTIQRGVLESGHVPESRVPVQPPSAPQEKPKVDAALPDQEQFNKYTVQRGDSWWKISQQFYGKGSRWKELYNFNGSPRVLYPGQVLDLPESVVGRTYQVIQGDSYWRIAKKMLGRGSRWREISRLNDNKPLIPGQRIRVPES